MAGLIWEGIDQNDLERSVVDWEGVVWTVVDIVNNDKDGVV